MDSTVMKIIKHEKRLKALGMEKLCHCDFAHDNRQNPRATNTILDYTANFKEMLEEGTGMIIYGNTGAGKTFAAAQIVNELTDRGYDCMFTSMSNIITELGTLGMEGKRNLFYQIFSKDLLVLDDLGAEVESSNTNQIFIQIVNTCLHFPPDETEYFVHHAGTRRTPLPGAAEETETGSPGERRRQPDPTGRI